MQWHIDGRTGGEGGGNYSYAELREPQKGHKRRITLRYLGLILVNYTNCQKNNTILCVRMAPPCVKMHTRCATV